MSRWIAFSLCFSYLCATPAVADQEAVIRDEIGSIIKSYDPRATFHLKVNTYSSSGSKKSAIPFAPNSGTSVSGKSYIGKIEVKIFAEDTAKLAKAKELVELYLANYSRNAKVTLSGLGSAKENSNTKAPWYVFSTNLTPQWITATTVGLSLLLLAVVVLIGSLKSTKAISSLESTVAGIGQSVMRANSQQISEESSKSPALDSDGVSEFKRYVEGLKPVSLLEMMSDCYWTENHQLASFLWNALWASHRSELTNQAPWLSDYAEFLLTQPSRFDQRLYSPYFLNPLSISHLDQAILVEQIRNHPEIYSLISEIRLETLGLSGAERIDLEISREEVNSSTNQTKISAILKSLPPSEPKSFASGKLIPLQSIEDEEALLSRSDLSLQVKMRIPTLAWLQYSDKEELSQKLRLYSAQDLASIWIGPEQVLRSLEEVIPEKKLKLLNSYRQKVDSPTRNHPVFRDLHQMGVAALQNSVQRDQHELGQHESEQPTEAA